MYDKVADNLCQSYSDLNSCLAEVEPQCELFAREHVWILCLVERSLELMQLERRERRATSTNLPRLVVVNAAAVHHAMLLLLRQAAVVVTVATVAMAIVVELRDVSDVVVAMLLLWFTVVVVVVVTSLLLGVATYLVCVAAPTAATRYNLQLYIKSYYFYHLKRNCNSDCAVRIVARHRFVKHSLLSLSHSIFLPNNSQCSMPRMQLKKHKEITITQQLYEKKTSAKVYWGARHYVP